MRFRSAPLVPFLLLLIAGASPSLHAEDLLGIGGGALLPRPRATPGPGSTAPSEGVAGPEASVLPLLPTGTPGTDAGSATGLGTLAETLVRWSRALAAWSRTQPGTPESTAARSEIRDLEDRMEDLQASGETLGSDLATTLSRWKTAYTAFWSIRERTSEDRLAIRVAEKELAILDRDVSTWRGRGMTAAPSVEQARRNQIALYHGIGPWWLATRPAPRSPSADRALYLTTPPQTIEMGIASRLSREYSRDLEILGARDTVP